MFHLEQLTTRSILTPTGGFLKPSAPGGEDGFTHTLNPAVGCPFGRGFCGQFCYARNGMAARMRGGDRAWGDYVGVKANAAELLEQELHRAGARPATHRHHIRRMRIFASSVTDPCAGPSWEVFRDCLRVLAVYPIRRIVIQTRSPLVLRLRKEIETLGPRAAVSFTLETDSDAVWSRGPQGAPTITQRRRVIEEMVDWRICRHLAISPCLPLEDPAQFAAWVARHVDLATVDTFTCGDGAAGGRTQVSPLPQIFATAGWDWRDESGPRRLFEELQRRMPGRAGWSCDGFRRLGRV